VGYESTTDAGHRAKDLPDLGFIEPTTAALVRQRERERRGGGPVIGIRLVALDLS
jgi:hypothetical protein